MFGLDICSRKALSNLMVSVVSFFMCISALDGSVNEFEWFCSY